MGSDGAEVGAVILAGDKASLRGNVGGLPE
jgi:hypothetical protein